MQLGPFFKINANITVFNFWKNLNGVLWCTSHISIFVVWSWSLLGVFIEQHHYWGRAMEVSGGIRGSSSYLIMQIIHIHPVFWCEPVVVDPKKKQNCFLEMTWPVVAATCQCLLIHNALQGSRKTKGSCGHACAVALHNSDAVIVNFTFCLSGSPVWKVTSVETLEGGLLTDSALLGVEGLSRGSDAGILQVPGCLPQQRKQETC